MILIDHQVGTNTWASTTPLALLQRNGFILLLMLLDHVNKFFFAEHLPAVFPLGRIVMPNFGFVLVYNRARPKALERGVHRRMMARLAFTGIVATPIAIALNGTVVSQRAWWPLNILFSLFTVVTLINLIERGGVVRYVGAAVLFVVAGAFIEYLWLGVLSLTAINANTWTLMAIPIVCLASSMTLRLPRRNGRSTCFTQPYWGFFSR